MATPTPLRAAGKNERRCISRQVLGYYRSLLITALYTLPPSLSTQEIKKETFFPALRHCIEVHPSLSAGLADAETEAPRFVRPGSLDLRAHVEVVGDGGQGGEGEREMLRRVLGREHDREVRFEEAVPGWKIIVLPLPSTKECYVLFSYSHALGDGTSGLAFHKTFLAGLRATTAREDADPICRTPTTPLRARLEDAMDLYVSWGYLLGPFLSVYLPRFVTRALGLTAALYPTPADAWDPSPYSYDAEDFRTGIEIAVVDPETLDTVLKACKRHQAKLTGVLHQIILRAMSAVVPDTAEKPAGSFVGQTAVNLRRLMKGWTNDDMGVATTADYEVFPRADGPIPSPDDPEARRTWKGDEGKLWDAAKVTTGRLAETASRTEDQPTGLLQYLTNFKAYTMGQLGKKRDCAFEVSNIMVFDPEPASAVKGEGRRWELGRILMTQPANATGGAISVNVATRRGGEMVVTLTWQRGVLGFGGELEEAEKMGRMKDLVEEGMERLAGWERVEDKA